MCIRDRLSTEQIQGIDGKEYEPAANLVRSGDYITAVDHQEISGKKDLLEAVEEISDDSVVLTCLLYTSRCV